MFASTGLNTKFGYRPYGSASGTAYVNAATVSKITPAKYSFEKAEATILASTQKDYVRSLADREASVSIRKDLGDVAFATMKTALVDSATANYDFCITYPDNSTQTFSGFVSDWSPADVEPTGVMSVDLTITIISPAVDSPAPSNQ